MKRCNACNGTFEVFAEQLNLLDETVLQCCPICAISVEEGEFIDE